MNDMEIALFIVCLLALAQAARILYLCHTIERLRDMARTRQSELDAAERSLRNMTKAHNEVSSAWAKAYGQLTDAGARCEAMREVVEVAKASLVNGPMPGLERALNRLDSKEDEHG